MLQRDIETVLSEISARIASDTGKSTETVRETVEAVYGEISDKATVETYLPVLTEKAVRRLFQTAPE